MNYVCSRGERFTLGVVALLAGGVSTTLTVLLCFTLTPLSGVWMPVTVGVVFELAKYTFGVIGLRILRQHPLLGLLTVALSIALIATSFYASMLCFNLTAVKETHAKVQQTTHYQAIEKELLSVEHEIHLLSESAA